MTPMRRAPTPQEARERAARRKLVAEKVLARGAAKYGCPCAWERFEACVAREHPASSMDDLQNALVLAAAKLPTFAIRPPDRPEVWLQDEWTCTRCGARWKHFSEEWRMMAYRERLVRADRAAPPTSAATAGAPSPPADPDAWAEFLLGEPLEP